MKRIQKSSVFKVTQADIEAYQLLHRAGFVQILANSPHGIIKAGNRIIKLAEQIKAERSAVAMRGIKGEHLLTEPEFYKEG